MLIMTYENDFASAFTSLDAAFDLAKSLISARDAGVVWEKVVELQRQIVFAQEGVRSAQSTLLSRLDELEKEVTELKKWNVEKEKYRFTDIGRGLFAYEYNKENYPTGPPHRICSNCYDEHHISVLQFEHRDPGNCDVLACHRCGSDLYLIGDRYFEHVQSKAVTRHTKR
jgi:hypothetical protein